jgi:hypothetical protein
MTGEDGTSAAADAHATVRDRLLEAGLSIERICEHLRAGRIRVDGQTVTDLDHPVPAGGRIVLVSR